MRLAEKLDWKGLILFSISHKKELNMSISDETDSFCGDIQIVQNLN
jgi:hypothetical protein